MNNANIMFSSAKDDWGTPRPLFEFFDLLFDFDLDAAASHSNALCARYYTKADDGLASPWFGNVWCNPPYGRRIYKWVEKAYHYNGLSCLLLPARVDTRWFHDFILNKAQVYFIKGRLMFNGARFPAPFPSMIVIFNNGEPFCESFSLRFDADDDTFFLEDV